MKTAVFALFIAWSLPVFGEPSPAPDAADLTKLLNEFLNGASHNDVTAHERFWADELIYTRSAGKRLGCRRVN